MSKLDDLYKLASKPGVNYYTVIGVTKDATEKEIRREFRKLSIITHPDNYVLKSQEMQDLAQECSALINVMYTTLMDPDKRAYYDKKGKVMESHEYNKMKNAQHLDADIDKLFAPIEDYARGANAVVTQTVTLRQVRDGGSTTVNFVLEDGTKKKTKVDVPQGVPNGTAVILEGLGSPGIGQGKSGDLIVIMVYQASKTVQFQGTDIKMLVRKPDEELEFEGADLVKVKLLGKWVTAKDVTVDKGIYTVAGAGLTNMLTMETGDLMLKVIG